MSLQPRTLLHGSGVLWLLTAVLGQWLFVAYLLMFYGGLVADGGFRGLAGTGLPGGYIEGDTLGNLMVAAHLLLAVAVMVGGPLQLSSTVRARVPAFHRWSGRIYLPSAVIAALSGSYLTVARDEPGDVAQDVGILLNAVLIVVFAACTLRFALLRKIDRHRCWALRLFLAVSGVWFFRIGLMLWFYLTGGIGIDTTTFSGPFLDAWTFGQYLLPLAVFEVFRRTLQHGSPGVRYGMASLMLGFTVLTALGIWRAYLGLWLPRM